MYIWAYFSRERVHNIFQIWFTFIMFNVCSYRCTCANVHVHAMLTEARRGQAWDPLEMEGFNSGGCERVGPELGSSPRTVPRTVEPSLQFKDHNFLKLNTWKVLEIALSCWKILALCRYTSVKNSWFKKKIPFLNYSLSHGYQGNRNMFL